MSEVVDIHKRGGKRKHFDVYIGRRIQYHMEFTEDSKWANRSPNLEAYEETIRATDRLWNALDELDGKILGCWCLNTTKTIPRRCHGQVLMFLLAEKKQEKRIQQMRNAHKEHYNNPLKGFLAEEKEYAGHFVGVTTTKQDMLKKEEKE